MAILETKDLTKIYGSGDTQVRALDGVSLSVDKGCFLAVVGTSGSGKSTLADLIPRFYDPTAGRVMVDGIDVRDLRVADLRSLMGNVNQEAILFNDTIFNNIAFGVENATLEQVRAAARIAAVGSGAVVPAVSGGRGGGTVAAAGQQAQGRAQGERDCKKLFHNFLLQSGYLPPPYRPHIDCAVRRAPFPGAEDGS